MSKLKYSRAGMMLVSILMLTLLLVMLTTSMLLMSSQNLNITGFAEKKAQALQAAEAGVEYAFYNINEDSTWGTSITSDITENLGNNQSFTIVFNSLSPEYSRNNLMNKTPAGTTTPGYSAEIISKGTYKGTVKTIRAVFVRDDIFPYPVCSEGEIWFEAWSDYLTTAAVYTVKGKNTTNPGRMHSNKKINIRGNDGPTADFSSGFISSKNPAYIFRTGNSVMKKESDQPLTIPDIDIANIILNRPACHTLTQDKMYLAGYFLYSADNYCVPVYSPSGEVPSSYGTAYKKGMISVPAKLTPSDPCRNFINDYADFYLSPLWNPNRNFYDYYPPPGSINFIDFDGGASSATDLQNELAVTFLPPDTTTDPNCTILTMRLDEDLYIDGITGIFQTTNIAECPGFYYICITMGYQLRLDLNGHKIYADKPLYLGIPVTGSGAIISSETIDFMLASDPNNLVVLSEKSINMTYREPYYLAGANVGINFKGILYAKDNLLIHSNSNGASTNTVNIYGALVAKDENPNNTANPPMSRSQYSSNNMNIHAFTTLYDRINILHTDDGLDTLVSLRGANFKVRKDRWEILK
jgi:hypothetical protein